MIIRKLQKAIPNAQKCTPKHGNVGSDIKDFVKNFCNRLSKDIVIKKDIVDAILILNHANVKEFSDHLVQGIYQLEHTLRSEISDKTDLKAKLRKFTTPCEILYMRVTGCGKKRPFCEAPCEAGGGYHTEHFTMFVKHLECT